MDIEQLKNLENDLWAAADKLRATSLLQASEHSRPTLGCILAEYRRQKGTPCERSLEAIGVEERGFVLGRQAVRSNF